MSFILTPQPVAAHSYFLLSLLLTQFISSKFCTKSVTVPEDEGGEKLAPLAGGDPQQQVRDTVWNSAKDDHFSP